MACDALAALDTADAFHRLIDQINRFVTGRFLCVWVGVYVYVTVSVYVCVSVPVSVSVYVYVSVSVCAVVHAHAPPPPGCSKPHVPLPSAEASSVTGVQYLSFGAVTRCQARRVSHACGVRMHSC